MALNDIKKEKENKLFKKGDIVVYVIIVIIVAVLFLSIFVSKDKSNIDGIEVKVSDKVLFTYSFSSNSYDIKDAEKIQIQKEESKYIVKVIDNEEFNIFEIDINNKKVKMNNANCSTSKDCCKMSIENMSDSIVCIPHRLVISPIGKKEIQDPIVG